MLFTRVQKVSSQRPDPEVIKEAAEVLRRGGLVAFPTETVYGLGADAFNPAAVQKVFDAKQRPADNPLIVHIADLDQLHTLTDSVPEVANVLAQVFWPGPLTLVVKRASIIPDDVTAHLDTVAVRMPNHRVTLSLIRQFGRGIVGPSANTSGKPSPTRAEHVYADLNGRIDYILDAGPSAIGVESTIIDVTVSPPVVLRYGGLPLERINEVIGEVQTTGEIEFLRRSPGTRHRHYAPRARVVIIEENELQRYVEMLRIFSNKPVGCILHSEQLKDLSTDNCQVVFLTSVEDLSRKLYDIFRQFDQLGVEIIIVEAVEEKGVGGAVMDRVRRASANVREIVY
jgi:L-threonylcarbamoyladenylate synthase